MSELTAIVRDSNIQAVSELVAAQIKGTKRGELVIIDFWTQMALEGRVFQVRAGTITTPLVGDVVITDTAAEMCADAISGYTILPAELSIGIRLNTGTLHEYAAKAVAAISTSGTAFVPLPLRFNGTIALSTAAATTARVQAAGAVTVAAELATTTLRLWEYANPVAGGAGNDASPLYWVPRTPLVLVGPSCFYVQIAATGTGPSYYAHFNYVELPSGYD